MNILIATGIYPPAIGGPSQYAKNIREIWEKQGYKVSVKTFDFEHILPSIVRHFYYFFKIIPAVISSDFIFALDTISVGWPATMAARLFGKKIIIRTGGDFLWENYVERTGDLVLFKDFYQTTQTKWTAKEKLIFRLTRWTLHHADVLIFSTDWQKNIWMKPYSLEKVKIEIVENRYGLKVQSFESTEKNFIAGARPLKWKNIDVLKKAFEGVDQAYLDGESSSYKEFMEKMAHCYAVILVSLGDISPNMILDAIHFNKPFIVTKENGLTERIKDIAIFVDPENSEEIKEKIIWLSKKENYDMQIAKLKAFTFTHTWEDIAEEILRIYKKI